MIPFLRVAVAIGFCIDAGVAVIALFFPQMLGPLLDIPARDPALATFAGGEFAIMTIVYALAFRDPRRFAVLFWIIAADQAAGAILPALEIARGHLAATIKTVGPIPAVAILAIVYAWGAVRLAKNETGNGVTQGEPRNQPRGT